MTMNRFLVVAMLTVGGLLATLMAPAGAIFNGNTPDTDEVPGWLVRLEWGDGGSGRCTGALVDHEVVLTGAHCLDQAANETISLFRTEGFNARISLGNIRDTAIHPNHLEGDDYADLALIRLQQPVPSEVETLRVSGRRTGHVLTTWGYGFHDDEFDQDRRARSFVGEVNTFSRNDVNCGGSGTFCVTAFSDVQGICGGDSGGPVVSATTGDLVGVTKAAINTNDGSLFTRGTDVYGRTITCSGSALTADPARDLWVRATIANWACGVNLISDQQAIEDDPARQRSIVMHGWDERAPLAVQHDVIVGTVGNDRNDGPSGTNDPILGRGGNDTICGRQGNDDLRGNTGRDIIYGGDGADTIWGHQGEDTLLGQRGNDTLRGGNNIDTIQGGDGNDHLVGGNGNDILRGGDGNDRLWGSAGLNDRGDGDGGTDTCVNVENSSSCLVR